MSGQRPEPTGLTRHDRWVNRVVALVFLVVLGRAAPLFLGTFGQVSGGDWVVYGLFVAVIAVGFVGGALAGLYMLWTGDDGTALSARAAAAAND